MKQSKKRKLIVLLLTLLTLAINIGGKVLIAKLDEGIHYEEPENIPHKS